MVAMQLALVHRIRLPLRPGFRLRLVRLRVMLETLIVAHRQIPNYRRMSNWNGVTPRPMSLPCRLSARVTMPRQATRITSLVSRQPCLQLPNNLEANEKLRWLDYLALRLDQARLGFCRISMLKVQRSQIRQLHRHARISTITPNEL